ncbi:MAG: hypothetical protein K0R87_718 [Pseudonocardia sp.]|nr:hypothetical protein [Pseudonocardia sp.]
MAVRLDVELPGLRVQFSGEEFFALSPAALARLCPVHDVDDDVTDVDD